MAAEVNVSGPRHRRMDVSVPIDGRSSSSASGAAHAGPQSDLSAAMPCPFVQRVASRVHVEVLRLQRPARVPDSLALSSAQPASCAVAGLMAGRTLAGNRSGEYKKGVASLPVFAKHFAAPADRTTVQQGGSRSNSVTAMTCRRQTLAGRWVKAKLAFAKHARRFDRRVHLDLDPRCTITSRWLLWVNKSLLLIHCESVASSRPFHIA